MISMFEHEGKVKTQDTFDQVFYTVGFATFFHQMLLGGHSGKLTNFYMHKEIYR